MEVLAYNFDRYEGNLAQGIISRPKGIPSLTIGVLCVHEFAISAIKRAEWNGERTTQRTRRIQMNQQPNVSCF